MNLKLIIYNVLLPLMTPNKERLLKTLHQNYNQIQKKGGGGDQKSEIVT